MSFFSDVVDVFTAPVRTLADVATKPLQVAASVVQGHNVAGAVTKAATTITGDQLNLHFGLPAALARTDTGKDLYTNGIIDKATLGLSGNFVGTSKTIEKASLGETLNKEDFLTSARFAIDAAALVGTPIALASVAPALGISKDALPFAKIGAYSAEEGIAASGLSPGALLGAVNAVGGAAGLPTLPNPAGSQTGSAGGGGSAPASSLTQNYFNSPSPSSAGGPYAVTPASAPAGGTQFYYSPTPAAQNINALLIAGLGVAALVLMRRGRK